MAKFDYSRLRHAKTLVAAPRESLNSEHKWAYVVKGSYADLTIPEHVIKQPVHFYWALTAANFFTGVARRQAEIIAARAGHILAPDGYEFCFRFGERKYLQSVSHEPHQGKRKPKAREVRAPHLNLGIIKQLELRGDKYGIRKVAAFMRSAVLGKDQPIAAECHAFFETDKNLP